MFPMRFSVRTLVWSDFVRADYDRCDRYDADEHHCYCGPDWDPAEGCSGRRVLDQIHVIHKSISSRNTLLSDVTVCLGLGMAANVFAAWAFLRATRGSPPPRPADP